MVLPRCPAPIAPAREPYPNVNSSNDLSTSGSRHWSRELTRYHWFVLIVAALGWLFDTMDQQLFNLARQPAMTELLATVTTSEGGEAVRTPPSGDDVQAFGGYATAIFLMGWAIGGLGFGVLGDRIGRAKTMMLTILVYSLFTGLSALSIGFWDFALYRFLTGLGVGGEFAVGVALVAEVMPDRARPHALGLLQALSAVGNITAALINAYLGYMQYRGNLSELTMGGDTPINPWRIMFLVGTIPALLAIVIRAKLKEPERWQATAHDDAMKKQLGSYRELFGDPRWRKRALVGMVMAFAGVVGLWGIGFFSPELVGPVLRARFEGQGLQGEELKWQITLWTSIMFIAQNIGGALGIWFYARVTHRVGRKPAFAVSYVMATASTIMVFWFMREFSQIFWMIPIMGFCQLALFGGYAIYFPELFPTRLRSTGTSFCYNVGRFVAAVGPFTLGILVRNVFSEENGFEEGIRYAGVAMSGIFLLGLLVLPFAPETRGEPLPE
jgi:MFS family permease